MMKTYESIPDYENKRKEIKEQIRKMREDTEHKSGGAIVHLRDYIEDMDKQNLFAQTQKLAKQQGKENVVNRLIKIAENHKLFNVFERKELMQNAIGSAYIGTLFLMGGIYSAAPLPVAGGAVLAAASIAYMKKQRKILNDVEKARFILKKYAKTGNLEEAQQKASAVEERMKKIQKAKTKKAFQLKNPFKTITER